jgi:uncharacterized membrane protein
MEPKFTYGEVLGFGWEKTKKHFWFFAGLIIIIWLAQVIPTGFANYFKHKTIILYGLFAIGAWIIQLIVRIGTTKIALDIVDKGKAELKTLFSHSQLLVKFILGTLLYLAIVLGGLVLFIVPGIIWGIKYQFFAYLIVDKNMKPMEAIKKSGEITMGNKSKLFWLGLLLILINIAGAVCFIVGLFVAIPIALMSMTYVYRKLMGELAIVPTASEFPVAANFSENPEK